MKKLAALLLLTSAYLFGFAGSVTSGESSQRPLPEELANYTVTDQTRKCVVIPDIKESRPLDDHHILFRLRNGDAYLNRLGRGCYGLRSNGSFSYSTAISRLCMNEIISVIDTFTPGALASCSLSRFEKLEEKPRSEGGA